MASSVDDGDGDTTLTIVTWNCNGLASGLGANVKFTEERGLGNFLRSRLRADVLCCQEHKLAPAKIPRELAVVDGFESFWASSVDKTGYSGVVTYCASPRWSPVAARAALFVVGGGATPEEQLDPLDREGRAVETDLGSLVLINVYVPNAGHGTAQRPAAGVGVGGGPGAGGDEGEEDDAGGGEAAAAAAGRGRRAEKIRFLRRLAERARELHAQGRSVVVVGDLNACLHDADVSPLIGPVQSVYSAEERAALGELLHELPDAWRALHPLPTARVEPVLRGNTGPERGEQEEEEEAGGGEGDGDGDGAAGGGGGGKRPPFAGPPPSAAAAAAAAAGPAPPSAPHSAFTVWDERTSARAFDRGLRIDYVLVSPRLLPLVASAEILGKDALPQKWSDHAAVRVVLRLRRRRKGSEKEHGGEEEEEEEHEGAAEAAAAGEEATPTPVLLAPPPPHAPCSLSSLVDERWALRPKGQKSISSFFGKRPATPSSKAGEGAAAAGGGAGAGAAAAAGAADKAAAARPAAKRARGDGG